MRGMPKSWRDYQEQLRPRRQPIDWREVKITAAILFLCALSFAAGMWAAGGGR